MSSPVALGRTRRLRALTLPRVALQPLLTVGLALVLCAVVAGADGGLRLGPTTSTLLALLLGGGATIAATLVLADRRERAWGAGPVLAFAALAILTALSLAWAVEPADAWFEANRTLTYLVVFATGVALAHALPGRWSALLGAITLAAVLVSAYSVLTKVAPGLLAENEIYGRLREPFGYWNAVGLMAALGIPGCLWLGARRTGHAALNALAHPALALLLLVILIAYSRGALAAAVVGVAVWFAVVPLRLRGLAVLLVGGAGALLMATWTFAQAPLTADRVPLELRISAGQQLGLLVVGVLALLLVAGLAVGFLGARNAPRPATRRRAGIAALVALALVPVGVGTSLALSERGLPGSISDGFTTLTSPTASQPPNEPGRLTAVGSVRARYWNEALKMFADNPAVGVGAGGYATTRPRYREDTLNVRHAHGFVVQTAADLGIAGLAAVLALIAAWLFSALRATGLRRRDRGLPFTPERVGLLTLGTVVVVFAAHSLVDFTWLVPGNAVPALLAAGWIVGRGPLGREPLGAAPGTRPAVRERLRGAWAPDARPRTIAAAATIVVVLAAAWMVWQPARSAATGQDALAALEAGETDRARELAQSARDRNGLSLEPLFELSVIESAAGRKIQARAALEQAVRLQPENPRPWLRLAEFELFALERPEVALQAIGPALFLDPRSSGVVDVFLQASRAATPAP